MTLPSSYNPHDVESHWYDQWEKAGLFKPSDQAQGDPFTIVIPPPNVTGILHMGHALNNTLQDILIRFKRMQGRPTLWVPGTDHAGIATQNVVERKLGQAGKSRHDLGREKFIKQVWDWKEHHGSTIVNQLRRLGASCDWSRERFTMDEGLSEAVQTTFLQLHKEGLIYRGYYLVNWCPRCQTALSDEEVQHEDVKGNLWYIRYPAADGSEGVVVATTRPETLLGDVAVAVHPKDDRFKGLHGQEVMLPVLNKKLPIITDPTVEREFGTGAVKITPAHDPTDFMLGQKHNLKAIRVMTADGKMNDLAGPYKGIDRFEARKQIVKQLKDEALLEKIEDYDTSIGHCYRCRTVVEPMLSPQWFVQMSGLAELGVEAVRKDGMQFVPNRWTKVYMDWLGNIRDWCISRQIWWGHRIPAWYCRKCYGPYVEAQAQGSLSDALKMDEKAAGIQIGPEKPKTCPACKGSDFVQDEDVLDTWFSSWLWPFSTLGWPKETPDLAKFYPTSVLVTGQDIIFFWVARMVMAGKHFLKQIPFKDIYIHGIIRVEGGKKMSKSLGNIIDPLEIIDKMGADTLRFSLTHMASEGQDLYLSEEKFLLGRNFCNKLWNAARFILEKRAAEAGEPASFNPGSMTLADQWILSRTQRLVQDLTDALENFRFNEAARKLYNFVWHEFCDWYLEIAKLQREAKDPKIVQSTDFVLLKVLETVLKLLHPIAPFITEALWERVRPGEGVLMTASWPEPVPDWENHSAEADFEKLQTLIGEMRNIRSTFRVPVKQKINLWVGAQGEGQLVLSHEAVLKRMGTVGQLTVQEKVERPAGSVVAHLGDWELVIPLEGLVDLDQERKRIQKELKELESRAKGKKSRLENPTFRGKAPAEVIAQEEELLKELEAELDRWTQSLKQIQ